MATRIYTATDSSSNVQLQHVCTVPDPEKMILTALGAALVLRGARSAGLIAVGLTLGGACILSRTLAGKPLGELLGLRRGRCENAVNAPSFRDEGVSTTQEPEDAIDEAAMESFPASDPPASHHSTQLPPRD